MKKILYILITIFSIAFESACKKDPLDITPSGRIDIDKIFSDETTARNYLASVYSNLPWYMINYYWYAMLAPKSDEAVDGDYEQNSLSSAQWNAGQLSATNNPLGIYNINTSTGVYPVAWEGIRTANIYLENADRVPFKSSTEAATTRAEAMGLRAYFLFEIIRNHGPMPILDHSLPVSFDYTTLTRPTYDECAQWIAKQCDSVVTILKQHNLVKRNQGEINRISAAFALALKSRVLLYNASPLNNPSNDIAKWQQAADAAKEVLALADQGLFSIYNNYRELFFRQDLGLSDFNEVIYQLPNEGTNNLFFPAINGIPTSNAVKSGVNPSQELIDAYEMTNGEPPILGYLDADHLQPIINSGAGYDPNNPYQNRDPRLAASIFCNGVFWGKINGADHFVEAFVGGSDGIVEQGGRTHTRTGYYIAKWIDPTVGSGNAQVAQGITRLWWTIFRLPEFYLNYAEAQNEAAGPTADVYNAVNKVRQRQTVNMPSLPAVLSKDQMRERIRNERRIEFAFEEHRFYDVRRWKILDKTDKVITGMRISKGDNFNTVLYKPADHSPLQITTGTSAGMSFTVATSFNTLGVACPNYGNNIGNLTLNIYSWKNTYSETIASAPVAGQEFVNFSDNATLTITMTNALPAGKYLFTLSNPVEMVGVWQMPEADNGAQAFLNGAPVDGAYEAFVAKQGSVGQEKLERIVVERRGAWQDRFLLMPIPLDDIRKMPGVTQNPGW